METHVTAKGQVVIPVALRRKYGITEGTKVHIYEENDRIILQPVTRETIRNVRGMFKGAGALKALVPKFPGSRGHFRFFRVNLLSF